MKAGAPLTLALLLGLGLAACNGGGSCGGDGWGDNRKIEAILDASCSGCHGDSFASCWDVHDSATSIEGAVASGAMPRGGRLAAADKAALLHWLKSGAACSGTRSDGSGGGGGIIITGEPPAAP